MEENKKQFYRIAITETYRKEVEIYAEDSTEAMQMAADMCRNNEITFDFENFVDRDTECRGLSRPTDLELHEYYGADAPAIQEEPKADLSDLIQNASERTVAPDKSSGTDTLNR